MKSKIYKWLQKLGFFLEEEVEVPIEPIGEIIEFDKFNSDILIDSVNTDEPEQLKEELVTLDKVPPELVLFYKLKLGEHSTSLTFNERANDYIITYIKESGYETKYLECVEINKEQYVIAATKQPSNIKVMLLLYSLYSFIKGGSDEILQYLIHKETIDSQKIFIFRD